MQKIKIPVTDSGAFDTALETIENNSPLFNKETETLFVKYKDDAIPIGSNVSYTKGLTALYFCGKFDVISFWPDFGHSAVIYLTKENEIDNVIRHPGFWVNIGTEEKPDWQPFCSSNDESPSNKVHVGTILRFALSDSYIPNGFIKCDGRKLNKIDYYELFDVIGNSYSDSDLNDDFLFQIPQVEDSVFTYIIKYKETSFDDLIGVVYDYFGEEIPTNFIDYNSDNATLESFELFLKIDENLREVNDNYFKFIKKYEANDKKVIVRALNSSTIPVGTVSFFSNTFVGDGYLKCDGSLVPKLNYPELYKVIGGKFGEVAVYFNLPKFESTDNYLIPAIKVGKIENNINL